MAFGKPNSWWKDYREDFERDPDIIRVQIKQINPVNSCGSCRGTDYTIQRFDAGRYAVICNNCHRSGKQCQSQADAINKWNAKNV